jgi:hypothetical protein
VRGAAARLVQTAYEHAFGVLSLSNESVLMLQLAANVLSDPEAAAEHLFGLDLRGSAR